ncbi:ATP-binding protein [Weissella paramesenteroides]|uniref:AAA family ATPase n=1 Tax=Weissella paramesenteroides TaxID=1249 RepID=UPI00223A6BA8|nr:ATP-binding protein [Weissella paramesenteroides]MCS9983985.1 ATP-binding protein [Weissella paramesenteroides]MCS9998997.1 ATP-binding protein [Weissella paramesenteroides]MCT0259800.1 ATP-binding protein [Weissella paramesenteroides]
MLIDLKVKNYLSIRDTANLSMEKTLVRKMAETNIIKGTNLLTSAYIFGPNGSGKTNLFFAIKAVKDLIIHPSKTIDEEINYRPFIFDDRSKEEPTEIDIEFITNQNSYEYHISFTNVIKSETLKRNDNFLYKRENNTVKIIDSKYNKFDWTQLRNNLTTISFLQNFNDDYSKEVFNWFNNELIFVDDINNSQSLANRIEAIINDDEKKYRFLQFLNSLGFKYKNFYVKKFVQTVDEDLRSILPNNIIENMIKPKKQVFLTLDEFSYLKKDGVPQKLSMQEDLPFGMESVGSQQLINLASILFSQSASDGNKTFLIDEYGAFLHSELAKSLIKIFNLGFLSTNQFIINTHNLETMDASIRADQIYFMDKNYTGVSNLYSLDDFNDLTKKSDFKFVRRYINGKFGANPQINIDEMLNSFKSNDKGVSY